jgi:hypothetical protein
MRRVEAHVGVPDDQRVDTTSTLGRRKRVVSVTQLVYFLLLSVATANAVGAVIVFIR